MRVIKREIKQNLLKPLKFRNASFVQLESEETQKFKYNIVLTPSKYIKNIFIAFKNSCNKIVQRLQLETQEVDFKAIKNDTSVWLIEALIEGFLINFIVWALIGWEFNFFTMLAWGFAVKQFLSIYNRLKKDGPSPTIPSKNK